jgi:hypothetical protein
LADQSSQRGREFSQQYLGKLRCRVLGSNQRRLSRRFYRPLRVKCRRALIRWATRLWHDLEIRSDPAYIPRPEDIAIACQLRIVVRELRADPLRQRTTAGDLDAHHLTTTAQVPSTSPPPYRHDARADSARPATYQSRDALVPDNPLSSPPMAGGTVPRRRNAPVMPSRVTTDTRVVLCTCWPDTSIQGRVARGIAPLALSEPDYSASSRTTEFLTVPGSPVSPGQRVGSSGQASSRIAVVRGFGCRHRRSGSEFPARPGRRRRLLATPFRCHSAALRWEPRWK